MPILRTDIERALDELTSQEEGMRFQGLAVVLGKKRWPELIAHQRKKDFGLDAYAPASETLEKFGKGLAASITPTLSKVSDDAARAKKNFSDLKALLFVTPDWLPRPVIGRALSLSGPTGHKSGRAVTPSGGTSCLGQGNKQRLSGLAVDGPADMSLAGGIFG